MAYTQMFHSKAADPGGQEPLKVPGGTQQTVPVYLGTTKGSTIPASLTNTTNLVLSDHVRVAGTINETVRRLVRNSPDLSAAIQTKIRSSLTTKYRAIAYDRLGRVDPRGTEVIHSFLTRLNYGSFDYLKFHKSTDLRTLSATLLLDTLRFDAMMVEVVLGKFGMLRAPIYLKAVPINRIEWANDTPEAYPVYRAKVGKVPLNYPTIFYSTGIQDSEEAYSESPLQAAIQVCLWDADFIDALRRAAVKNLLQRMKVAINSEKYISSLPDEIKNDPKKLKAHQTATVTEIEAKLNNLSPDDAIVVFDSVDVDMVADANRSEDRSMNVLHSIINGKIATGAKILPSVIGRGESSNAASTESLLFLKTLASLQIELNMLYSRIFTFCLRLFGMDGYVKFEMEEVNLRPSLELESFRAIKQSRTFHNLSIGFVTDVAACIEETGQLPPPDYQNKSGTMFEVQSPNVGTGNDYSNTSVDTSSGKTNSTQSQKTSEAKKTGVKSQ